MKIMPPIIEATLKSMKRTLHENPALIPLTPDGPATLDGSLHPGHAKSEGAKFNHRRLSNETSRTMRGI
jgi:hypothetical protein